MAHFLSLVTGPSSISLNSTSAELAAYTPQAPTLDAESMGRLLMANQQAARGFAVTESAIVQVSGSSPTAVKSIINTIEGLLNTVGPLRQVTSGGCRLYAHFQPDGLSTLYRSEILNGRVDYDQSALEYIRWTHNRKVRVTVAWTRMPYWESACEVQIPIANGGAACSTCPLTLFNHDDADSGHDNYAQMSASDVLGILPAPPRIEINHTSASAKARRFYWSHKATGDPASFTHILEAESASINATYCATATCTLASSGCIVTVTNVPSTAASLFGWTIDATQIGYATNSWLRLMGRFFTPPNASTIKIRATLYDPTSNAIIEQSDYTTLTTTDNLQVLATLYLSPTNDGLTTYGPVILRLDAKDSSAAGDFNLDFTELAVVEYGSSFRYLVPIDETNVGVPITNGQLVDNMTEGGLYMESRQRVYVGYGGPIMLMPNTLQRLYCLHDVTGGCAPILNQIAMKLFHRPRLLTL